MQQPLSTTVRRELVRRGLSIPDDAGDETLVREDLGWDSLDIAIVLEFVCERNPDFDEDAISSVRNLRDVAYLVDRLEGDDASQVLNSPRRSSLEWSIVTPGDLPFMTELYGSGDAIARGRFRALTPSPQALAQLVWEDVLVQFLLRRHGAPVGHMYAYSVSMRHQHCSVGLSTIPEEFNRGVVVREFGQFVSYLFAQFPLAKVYAYVLECNDRGFGRSAFGLEGKLRSHEFVDGEWVDLLIYAATRPEWKVFMDRQSST